MTARQPKSNWTTNDHNLQRDLRFLPCKTGGTLILKLCPRGTLGNSSGASLEKQRVTEGPKGLDSGPSPASAGAAFLYQFFLMSPNKNCSLKKKKKKKDSTTKNKKNKEKIKTGQNDS